MKKFKRTLAVVLSVVLLFSAVPMGVFNITASAEKEYATNVYRYTVKDGKATIISCVPLSGDVTLPSKLGGYPVVSLGHGLNTYFENVQSITVPNGIVSIGDGAFSCKYLKSVTIPESVTSIGESAFFGCEQLKKITVSSKNK